MIDRRTLSRTFLLASLLVLVPIGVAQIQGVAGVQQGSAKADDFDSLSFLAGHWRQEAKGSVVEELWMPPSGALMLGLNRTVPDKGRAGFEFLRIERRPDGIFYVAQPSGSAPTAFELTKVGAGLARFENPEHDFPKVIEYRVDEEERLIASISGDDGHGMSWTFEKVGEVE